MLLKEFEELIKKDSKLQEKFEEGKKSISVSNKDELFEALSKLAKDLGFDVPVSEFKLKHITKSELNEEELKAVAGGSVQCKGDFTDTDCHLNDYCDFLTNHYEIDKCFNTSDHEGCAVNDRCAVFYRRYHAFD